MSFLAETDQAYADYIAAKLRCEILCKRVITGSGDSWRLKLVSGSA